MEAGIWLPSKNQAHIHFGFEKLYTESDGGGKEGQNYPWSVPSDKEPHKNPPSQYLKGRKGI